MLDDEIDPQKPRFFQTQGGTKFREFGVLEKVELNDWGVHLYNQHGFSVGMKKIYYSWASVYQKAQLCVGANVVIETGGSASSQDYFRDIYADNPGNPLLKVPEDAGDDSASALVWARVRNEQLSYELSREREQRGELQERYEDLTRSDKEEQEHAQKKLDEVWDDWMADPNKNKSFNIIGAAYKEGDNKKPDKIDKAFALRLGINTMNTKRIVGNLQKRTYRNNIRVELPAYGGIECQLALTYKKGEWVVKTVTNVGLSGWQSTEDKLAGDWRTTRKRVEYYLNKHEEILDAVVRGDAA